VLPPSEEFPSKQAAEPAPAHAIQPLKSIVKVIDRTLAGLVLLGATLVAAAFVARLSSGDGIGALAVPTAILGVMTFVAWQALGLWNGSRRARTRMRWVFIAQVASFKVNVTIAVGGPLTLHLPVHLDYEWYSIGKLGFGCGLRSGLLVEYAIGPMARLSVGSGADNFVGVNLLSLALLAALLHSARLAASATLPAPERVDVPVLRFENGRLLLHLAARKAHAILACWVCVVVVVGVLFRPSLEAVDRAEVARDGEAEALLARLQAQCEGGEHEACHDLGVLYDAGKAVPRDWAVARGLYERACNHGVVQSCYNLGQNFFDEGEASRLPDAEHWLGAGCRLREEHSCARLFAIGQLYAAGKLIAKDDSRAATVFDESCAGVYSPACHSLGVLIEQGLGRDKDLPKAAALYQKACEGKFMPACSNLGTLYDEGEGLAVDKRRAAELYSLACDAELPQGCMNLGLLWLSGEGVKKDVSRARALFSKWCAAGEARACAVLSQQFGERKPSLL
jgi:TPR repeat protein